MGQTGSRVANKIANSFSFSETPSDEYMVEVANTAAVAGFKGTPFVFTRRGYVSKLCALKSIPNFNFFHAKCKVNMKSVEY